MTLHLEGNLLPALQQWHELGQQFCVRVRHEGVRLPRHARPAPAPPDPVDILRRQAAVFWHPRLTPFFRCKKNTPEWTGGVCAMPFW